MCHTGTHYEAVQGSRGVGPTWSHHFRSSIPDLRSLLRSLALSSALSSARLRHNCIPANKALLGGMVPAHLTTSTTPLLGPQVGPPPAKGADVLCLPHGVRLPQEALFAAAVLQHNISNAERWLHAVAEELSAGRGQWGGVSRGKRKGVAPCRT